MQLDLKDSAPEDPDLEVLKKKFKELRRESWSQNERIEQLADRTAKLGVAILCFEPSETVWRLLDNDEPRVVSLLIDGIPQLVRSDRVIDHLDQLPTNERDPTAIAMRHGVMACLAGYVNERGGLSDAQRRHLIDRVGKLCLHDEHPGVHSSADLLLRRLGAEVPAAPPVAATEAFESAPDRLGWWRSPHGFTMAVIPEMKSGFTMGSPWGEKEREQKIPGGLEKFEFRREVQIPRSFAISMTEVTMRDVLEFAEASGIDSSQFNEDTAADPDCPGHGLTWEQAARYCNWLSAKEGIPPKQHCYTFSILGGMWLKENHLTLTGYRLPTEAEYEMACRAGTSTARHFGESARLLPNYAWHLQNTGEVSMPVATLLPNQWGLFDTLGNIAEWCDDPPGGGFRIDSNRSKLQPAPDGKRPIRGGAFTYGFFSQVRSAAVDRSERAVGDYRIGFRVARTLFASEE